MCTPMLVKLLLLLLPVAMVVVVMMVLVEQAARPISRLLYPFVSKDQDQSLIVMALVVINLADRR